jgi:uncharacterized protein
MVNCEVFIDECSKRAWCKRLLTYVLALQGYEEAHGFPHTIRVACNALWLAQDEAGVDIDVILAASLLHDIGRGVEGESSVHHSLASKVLAEILLDGAGFPRDKKDHVLQSIEEHSFSLGKKPSTRESCIVSDADKLDALGAIGFYRAALVSEDMGRPPLGVVSHYYEKLSLLPKLMCTGKGKEEAEKRLSVLSRVIELFKDEVLTYEDAIVVATKIAIEDFIPDQH